MKLIELPESGIRAKLAGEGLTLKTGPFSARIRTSVPFVAAGLVKTYQDYPVLDRSAFADFECCLRPPFTVRRWHRPQVLFLADGRSIFKPLPLHQAFPVLEWGMNWCIANQVHDRLVFHAAAVEKDGKALILPAPPGSGKSTLCAALVASGWRLITDESVLVDLRVNEVTGPVRPISLKNASIEVIKDFGKDVALSDVCRDTLKGTVAHMRAPTSSVERADEPAKPAWIVFPNYRTGAPTRLEPLAAGDAFMRLVNSAFNYATLGRLAFHRTADLIEQVDAYTFVYSRLDEAIETFNALPSGR